MFNSFLFVIVLIKVTLSYNTTLVSGVKKERQHLQTLHVITMVGIVIICHHAKLLGY